MRAGTIKGMGRTVLIVEDTAHSTSTLEVALLTVADIDVVVAADGRQALEFLNHPGETGPRVLVTDLNMPRLDGFELIERVRRDRRYERLPIIVLSGDTDPRTPERLRRLGADAFFTKPYSPGEVRAKIEELLDAYPP
jgi:DNA-binding response OmpR family regulator